MMAPVMRSAARWLLVAAVLLAVLGLPAGGPPKGAELGLSQGGPLLVAKGGANPAPQVLSGFFSGARSGRVRRWGCSQTLRPTRPGRRRRLYLLYARLNLEGG